MLVLPLSHGHPPGSLSLCLLWVLSHVRGRGRHSGSTGDGPSERLSWALCWILALSGQPPREGGGGVGSSVPGGHAGLALSGGHRRVVALAICPPMGLEGRLLVSVCVSLVSGGISFSRHWVFGSQATLRVFPPVCLVLVHGQGLHVSGGSAPTVLAAPCGAADESRFLTTAPLCSSVFLVKMCIFLFNKF